MNCTKNSSVNYIIEWIFCDLVHKIIIHLLGVLSLVSPRIFCVHIIPMLHYVINISCAYMFVTSGFHLDYNTQILYNKMHLNFYKKLQFLSHFILQS